VVKTVVKTTETVSKTKKLTMTNPHDAVVLNLNVLNAINSDW